MFHFRRDKTKSRSCPEEAVSAKILLPDDCGSDNLERLYCPNIFFSGISHAME